VLNRTSRRGRRFYGFESLAARRPVGTWTSANVRCTMPFHATMKSGHGDHGLIETINFTRGVPANESFPIDEVIEAAAAILKTSGAAMLQYGPSLGFQPLREWLAQVL